MKTILKLKPSFREKIWGGDRLQTQFHYAIPSDHTGECWAISGHPAGNSIVENGAYAGRPLGELWDTHRELFGNLPGDTFPLLVKILDARQDLSIQVHPNDAYAVEHENGALGKTECWYVLECDENASIIIGHHAQSKQQMAQMVAQEQWDALLRRIPVHRGDFFQIEPGCLHAICGGTMILETQQSSDVTYRFYDYGRLENGKPRTLHLEKSMDVVTVPFEACAPTQRVCRIGDAEVTHLVSCEHYSVGRVCLNGSAVFDWDAPFVNVSILQGSGMLDDMPVQKGEHMILCADYGQMTLRGDMQLLYSHVGAYEKSEDKGETKLCGEFRR